jgi:hypothetical protein
MNRKANETFEMVTRTGDFAITSVGLFPKTSAATEIAAALEAGVKTLKEEARNIASAEMTLRSCGSVRSTARENLNIMLGHVSTIGEALNSTRFSLPARRSDRMLIDTGRAFAVEAEPLAKEFAKHGIRIEAITATVHALEDAIRSGANARAARKAAHEKWTTALEEALMDAKRLDVLVETTITDTGPLAAYAAARTVRHAGGHKTAVSKTTEVTPPSIVAPTAVTATATAA